MPSSTAFLIGVVSILLSAFAQSLGLTLQRKSHLLYGDGSANTLDDLESRGHERLTGILWSKLSWAERRYLVKSRIRALARGCIPRQHPMWVAGVVIYVLSGAIGSVVGVGTLPVAVLAPLGSTSLIFNVIFAWLLLHDQSVLNSRTALATLLVMVGATLMTWFGSLPEPSRSLDELVMLYTRPAFLKYIAVTEVVMVAVIALTEWTLWQLRVRELKWQLTIRGPAMFSFQDAESDVLLQPDDMADDDDDDSALDGSNSDNDTMPLLSRLQGTVGTEHTVVRNKHKEEQHQVRYRAWCGLVFGMVSGAISSQSLLLAKSGAELVTLTLFHKDASNQFTRIEAWIIVVATVAAILLNLYYLNRGLQLCDTVKLVPLTFCSYNASSLVNSIFYYDQWRLLTVFEICGTLTGVVLLSIGVLMLSMSNSQQTEIDRHLRVRHATALTSLPRRNSNNESEDESEDEDEDNDDQGMADDPLFSPGDFDNAVVLNSSDLHISR